MTRTLWNAAREWNNDSAAFLGAALAYYSLFSIAPLLLLAVAITGLAFGEAAAQGRVFDFLRDYVGDESAQFVQHLVLSSSKPSAATWSSLVATGILAWAALGLFRQLKTGLNLVWKLPPIERIGIIGWAYDLLLAVILVLCTGLFILFLTTASMMNAYLADLPVMDWIQPWAWRALDFAVVTLLQVLILAFTFRLLSEGRVAYRHAWGGAVVAAVLLTIGKSAFSLYLRFSHPGSIYSEAGSVVVFLVWIYYSAQIVFYGAEVVKVLMMNEMKGSLPVK